MEFLELFLRRRFAEGNQWWRRMTGYLSVHCWPVSTLSKLIHFECFAVLRSYPLVKNLTSFQIQRTNVSLLASHWYGRCDVPYIQHVAKTMRKRKILRILAILAEQSVGSGEKKLRNWGFRLRLENVRRALSHDPTDCWVSMVFALFQASSFVSFKTTTIQLKKNKTFFNFAISYRPLYMPELVQRVRHLQQNCLQLIIRNKTHLWSPPVSLGS